MTLRREDLDGGITVLTIDRPEARNALSPEIRGLFAEHCESMAEDEAIRAVVITGAGGHFCARARGRGGCEHRQLGRCRRR